MVKVTLPHHWPTGLYTIITDNCCGCFQYPVSSGGAILKALYVCVLKCGWKAPPKSFKEERDLKVTLCISRFLKLTFSLYYSAQYFALQWKSFFSPLRNKLFPIMRKHEYCMVHWTQSAKSQLLSQNTLWVWTDVGPPTDNDRLINTLI